MKLKRLFFDIEVSPNVVFSWTVGYKLNISYENIIKERAIVCICYKWEGDDRIHCLKWDKGNDKKLLMAFSKVIEQADEVIGHNGDNFDLKWLRTRSVFHGIPVMPGIKSIDTLKLAKAGFRFNSNRLDYIAQFLGIGNKIKTEFSLWKEVVNNNIRALQEMIRYCKHDVKLLELVYSKLEAYGPIKTHAAVIAGGYKSDCPKCASANTKRHGFRVTASGMKKQLAQCLSCGRRYTVSETTLKRDDAARAADVKELARRLAA